MSQYLSTTAILDETPAVMKRIGVPWLGFFWLTNMPLRFMQANFFLGLFELGPAAKQYGNYLENLAVYVCAAFVLAVYGKAVFVRACNLSMQSGGHVGWEALKVYPAQFFNFLYLALLIEVVFYLLISLWWITLDLYFLLAGIVAVAALRTERPGIFLSLQKVFSLGLSIKMLVALLLVFTAAFFLALINVYVLLVICVWAAGGVSGIDPARWEYILRPVGFFPLPAENLAIWLCVAGAALIIEPFWLAALAVSVQRSKQSETGEDLRLWFEKIKATR